MRWRLAVVGSPIAHSLSPLLHEKGLAMAGLEGTSTRVELGREQGPALRELLDSAYDAVSVTMPLKKVAAGLCTQLDEVATRIGVVNSVLVRDGELRGACTDGRGFVDSLAGEFGLTVTGKHVVVLGAGGAAHGIIDALVEANVGSVAVQNRTPTTVRELTDRYDTVVADAPLGAPVDLIVNTIPTSGRPDVAVLHDGVHEQTLAVDIIYEPRMSNWRAFYESHGCRSANGLGMLAYQAARQMQWWWDTPMDGAQLLEVLQ